MSTLSKQLEYIADYFIAKSNSISKSITNKKLQKLVYYAQSWSLALDGKPLFRDNIEAWAHGPAIKSLYLKYKKYGYQPLRVQPVLPTFDSDAENVLSEVWRVYGHLDADYLEALTHNEQPWVDARGNASEGEASDAVIDLESMKSYYKRLLSES